MMPTHKKTIYAFVIAGLYSSASSIAYGADYNPTPNAGSSSWFVGAKGSILKPYFERDIVGADEDDGPNGQLKILTFDWSHNGAYRAWIGHDNPAGFSWSLGHSIFNASTNFSKAEGNGRIESEFDPDSDDADIRVDGTLKAKNELSLGATDLEFWTTTMLGQMNVRYGGGVRYGTIDRSFHARETQGNEFIKFKHEFRGLGPSLNYTAEVPVGQGYSIYNSARAAFLFGEHQSRYRGENANGDSGQSSNDAFVTTLDTEFGLQWRGPVGNGDLTLRAGVDAQAWFNGGGWDMYRPDGGALFPQQAGSFGALGIAVSAQYNFGGPSGYGSNVNAYANAPEIVTPGFFVGFEGGLAVPSFERDIIAGDESAGSNNELKILTFDWDAGGAYRGWIGYETASGTGVSLSHSIFNHSTDYSKKEGNGSIQSHFDPDSDDADIYVDGTLKGKNKLDLRITDLDVWQTVDLGNSQVKHRAGLRHLNLDRSVHVTETGGDEFIRFDHEFNGFGPSLGYDAEVPMTGGFALYHGGRAALLFGEHMSQYRGENTGSDRGESSNFAMLPTFDAELGVQWRGQVGAAPGELTLRAGIDAQAFINGGGWDLYDDDMGATFPQQTGNFGALAFNVSAQYKFGAPVFESVNAYANTPDITTAGWIIGAEGAFVTPYFERDIVAADESFGPNNELKVFSFDWDGHGAYAGWVGYEFASGLGLSLTHSIVDNSTSFSRAEGNGNLKVEFDPDSDDVDIYVNGTLKAKNSLSMNVTDLEFWQRANFGNVQARFGAGIRHASFERRYHARETQGNEFIRFKHDFTGWGPSLNYEVEAPIANGFSLYNSGRAAILFGKHESRYQGENAGSDAGSSENTAMLPTIDGEIGIQWRGQTGSMPGELTLRAGLDAQAWVSGGGWDMYTDDGGADFPQQAGSFALTGFKVSAQYKF